MTEAINLGSHVYRGGCHCGAVVFRFEGPEAFEVLSCNCSICSMTGYLHLTVPHAAFELLSGQEALVEYRFNTGAARHLFCRHCGIKSFYQPRSHPHCYSVNLRCVADAEQRATVQAFDGQHWEAAAQSLRSGTAGS